MAEAKMPESLEERFPGNSYKEKREREDAQKRENNPVVDKGVAKRVKPSVGHKLRDTFDNEDTRSVFSYIWNNVLVPAAKDMLFEAVSGGLSMRLFGSARGYSRPTRTGYTNYNKITRPAGTTRSVKVQQPERRSVRPRIHNSYDVTLPSKGLAYEVLDRLCSSIEQCGYATVQDLCQVLNWDSDYTDEYLGWTDMSSARIRPRGDEWVLELPPTVAVDDDSLPF